MQGLKEDILIGKFILNPKYIPANSVVFSIVFSNKDITEQAIFAVTGEKVEILAPSVEQRNDMQKANETAIWFDVFALSKDSRIFTLDMHRYYAKSRNRNRNVYYSSKALSAQSVNEGRYEHLKQVSIVFIFEKNTTPDSLPMEKIQMHYAQSKELYTDLLTIYEVNLNRQTEEEMPSNATELRDFLSIKTQEDLCCFVRTHETAFAGRLLEEYVKAVADDKLLIELEGSNKIMWKLTEERLLEERIEGKAEGKAETAIEMLKRGFEINAIADIMKMPTDWVEELMVAP